MLVGVSKQVITPRVGSPLFGYKQNFYSTGVYDDLEIGAIYFDDGKNKCALLTYDLISLKKKQIRCIQETCSQTSGIDPGYILITASHNHSGPPIHGFWFWESESESRFDVAKYFDRVVEKSAEALKDAQNSVEEIDVFYNCGYVKQNINRDIILPDGRYFYLPNHKYLQSFARGPVDQELGIVYFQTKDNYRIKALIVNYTAHPLTVGDSSSLFTSDYPGALRREVKRTMGGQCLFINGACGNNHPIGAEAGFSRMEQLGKTLAEQVCSLRFNAIQIISSEIKIAYEGITLPLLRKEEWDKMPDADDWKKKRPFRNKADQKETETYFSLLALGPILFVGVPGELCVELGFAIKWNSPFPRTYIMYLGADNVGYIPHRNAYTMGSYEAYTSVLSPQAGRILVERILDRSEQLRDLMPDFTLKSSGSF